MAGEFEVIVTRTAKKELDGIIHYLMTNYSSNTALKAAIAIDEQIEGLARYPESKTRIESKGNIVYRYTIARKVYRLVFTIQFEKKRVIVLRMVHVRADMSRVLGEIEEE